MKRLLDLVFSVSVLLLLSPLLLIIIALIFLYDFHSPFYIAPRVGRGGKLFKMVKFRSMIVHADKTGVSSTAATDKRITPIGHFVRRYKLDELMQLWNVMLGDMSLVGPRPNVQSGVAVYTDEEKKLLHVKPGITDFSSIVFADEGEILQGYADADHAYDQLIRPWKSRLGLFYIQHMNTLLDIKLIFLTVMTMISRTAALTMLSGLLAKLGASTDLVKVAVRSEPLIPVTPLST